MGQRRNRMIFFSDAHSLCLVCAHLLPLDAIKFHKFAIIRESLAIGRKPSELYVCMHVLRNHVSAVFSGLLMNDFKSIYLQL